MAKLPAGIKPKSVLPLSQNRARVYQSPALMSVNHCKELYRDGKESQYNSPALKTRHLSRP